MGCGNSTRKKQLLEQMLKEEADRQEESQAEEERRKKLNEENNNLNNNELTDKNIRKKIEDKKNEILNRITEKEKAIKEELFQHRKVDEKCEYGYEDEIYNDINYGKPIKIGKQTWLTYDFGVLADENNPKVNCPTGWRIPYVTDYLEMFKYLGKKAFKVTTNKAKLNMKTNRVYLTRSKSDPWVFQCVDYSPIIQFLNGNGMSSMINDSKEKVNQVIGCDDPIPQLRPGEEFYHSFYKKMRDVEGKGYNNISELHEIDRNVDIQEFQDRKNNPNIVRNKYWDSESNKNESNAYPSDANNTDNNKANNSADIYNQLEDFEARLRHELVAYSQFRGDASYNDKGKDALDDRVRQPRPSGMINTGAYNSKNSNNDNRLPFSVNTYSYQDIKKPKNPNIFYYDNSKPVIEMGRKSNLKSSTYRRKSEFEQNLDTELEAYERFRKGDYVPKEEDIIISALNGTDNMIYTNALSNPLYKEFLQKVLSGDKDTLRDINLNDPRFRDLDDEIKEQIQILKNLQREEDELDKRLKKVFPDLTEYLRPTNIFIVKDRLVCKLIADEVIDINFNSDIVGQVNEKMSFEIPKLYNITTFKWNFTDKDTSDKKVAVYSFSQPGEYEVKLDLILFHNRQFIFTKNIWIMPQIEYGNDEITDEVNYGVPIKLGTQIWLNQDLSEYKDFEGNTVSLKRGKGPGKFGENSYVASVSAAPLGWRVPTVEEVRELLDFCGNSAKQRIASLLKPEIFNVKLNKDGIYDAICLDFIPEPVKIPPTSLKSSIEESNVFIEVVDNPHIQMIESKFKKVKHELDDEFIAKLRNYDRILLLSMNFSDIYNKEAYSLSIDNNSVGVGNRSTSMCTPKSFFSTRCIACQSFELEIKASSTYFELEKEIHCSIVHPNVLSYEWDFGDQNNSVKFDKNTSNPSYKYLYAGEYMITCKVTLFGNRNISASKKVFVYSQIQKIQLNTKLKKFNQILVKPVVNHKVKRNDLLHLTNPSVCIAKRPISSGGCLIAFQDINMQLNVLIFDEDKFKFSKPIYNLDNALPLDIVYTDKGYVLLLRDTRDPNILLVQHISESGETVFSNVIMCNGHNPVRAEINQIIFFDNEGKPVFGMNAMHRPISGKLAYGNGRILVIFSYTNYFGATKGVREDHLGESIISYKQDGTEVNLAKSWSTSHSLAQIALFNDNCFITASLGDAYPQNIRVYNINPKINNLDNLKNPINNDNLIRQTTDAGKVFADGFKVYAKEPDIKFDHILPLQSQVTNNDLILSELNIINQVKNNAFSNISRIRMNIRHEIKAADIIPGSIPADMKGHTSGRLGGLSKVGDLNMLTYSRINCFDSGLLNKENELALIIFNNDLNVVKQCKYKDGDGISCIKSAAYGENTLIMFSKTNKMNGQYLIDYVEIFDESCCFLINKDGEKISNDFNMKFSLFNPNDDFVTLEDGSVVWPFIDFEDNLYLCFLDSKYDASNREFYRKRGLLGGERFYNYLVKKKEKKNDNEEVNDHPVKTNIADGKNDF
jgi:hypothetical protein